MHRDYYLAQGEHHFEQDHLDHCIEIIRINLMCTSDVSILTYNWVRGIDHPTPNFNTEHKYRDFEAILSWAEDHKKELGSPRRVNELNQLP
jgi:hypothetical protein